MYSTCWAFGFAHATVNTFVWVDDQEFWPFLETVNRADYHAVLVLAFDASTVYNICHFVPP
jgi:hypothetical protein